MSSGTLQTEEFQEKLIDAILVAKQYMPDREEVSKEAFSENTESVLNDVSLVEEIVSSLQPKYRIIANNPVSGSVAENAYTDMHRDLIVAGLEKYNFQDIKIEKL